MGLIYIVYCCLLIRGIVVVADNADTLARFASHIDTDVAIAILSVALIIELAIVALLIWTMIVANRARKEILNPDVNKA